MIMVRSKGDKASVKPVLYLGVGNQDRYKELTEWWVFRQDDRQVRGLPLGPRPSGVVGWGSPGACPGLGPGRP